MEPASSTMATPNLVSRTFTTFYISVHCSYREGENIKVAINCWNNGVVCVCVPSSHHLQEGHADVEALVQLALPHDPHICYVQQTQVALHHTFC